MTPVAPVQSLPKDWEPPQPQEIKTRHDLDREKFPPAHQENRPWRPPPLPLPPHQGGAPWPVTDTRRPAHPDGPITKWQAPNTGKKWEDIAHVGLQAARVEWGEERGWCVQLRYGSAPTTT